MDIDIMHRMLNELRQRVINLEERIMAPGQLRPDEPVGLRQQPLRPTQVPNASQGTGMAGAVESGRDPPTQPPPHSDKPTDEHGGTGMAGAIEAERDPKALERMRQEKERAERNAMSEEEVRAREASQVVEGFPDEDGDGFPDEDEDIGDKPRQSKRDKRKDRDRED